MKPRGTPWDPVGPRRTPWDPVGPCRTPWDPVGLRRTPWDGVQWWFTRQQSRWGFRANRTRGIRPLGTGRSWWRGSTETTRCEVCEQHYSVRLFRGLLPLGEVRGRWPPCTAGAGCTEAMRCRNLLRGTYWYQKDRLLPPPVPLQCLLLTTLNIVPSGKGEMLTRSSSVILKQAVKHIWSKGAIH